jgi:glycosyltransferase involved in cell wall biosynthesis
MLSIIIPSRNERFLQKTILDILSKAKGEIQVIANLDGYWPPAEEIVDDPRVIYLHHGTVRGLRHGINAGVAAASGENIMKIDGHCMFDEGFDVKLAADCEEDWVVIPSRYSLDGETWTIDRSRPRRDYHYLCYPDPHKDHDMGMHGVEWLQRGRERQDPKYDIDDNMSFQGSCWFMHRKWFVDFLEGMSEEEVYNTWAQEPTEIGCKTWLGGGRVVCNKKTWYAHLYKGRRWGRGYRMDDAKQVGGHNYAADYWMNNRWPKQVRKIDWLVEKFMPVPTWPEDRKLWVSPLKRNG